MIAGILTLIVAIAFVALVARTLGVPLRHQPSKIHGPAIPDPANTTPRRRAPARLLLGLLLIAAATALLVVFMLRWVGKLLQRWLS